MRAPSAAGNLTDQDELEQDLPRLVLACWPRTWREDYGDEMSQTWCDEGSSRKELPSIAVLGLRQRVTRPVAAASLDTTAARPCHDIAIIDHPRYLLRSLIATAVLMTIFCLEIGVTLVLGSDVTSAGYSVASMQREEIRMGLLMTISTGLPLGIAAWGSLRLNHPTSRDSGFGLIFGAIASIALIFVLPAVAG